MKKKAQEKKRNIYGRKTLLPVVMARAAYKYSHFDVLQDCSHKIQFKIQIVFRDAALPPHSTQL